MGEAVYAEERRLVLTQKGHDTRPPTGHDRRAVRSYRNKLLVEDGHRRFKRDLDGTDDAGRHPRSVRFRCVLNAEKADGDLPSDTNPNEHDILLLDRRIGGAIDDQTGEVSIANHLLYTFAFHLEQRAYSYLQ